MMDQSSQNPTNPSQTAAAASPVASKKRPKIVGDFVRTRREALNLSQKAVGALFNPVVTTQFISNVERGVTPLPPAHIQTLCQALQVKEEEFRVLLEQEYAAKLGGKLGQEALALTPEDKFIAQVKKAYLAATPEVKLVFQNSCRDILKTDNT
jgi:transcriptional regulator with XRE-family HTH domain